MIGESFEPLVTLTKAATVGIVEKLASTPSMIFADFPR
jgi:hypothetical protein